MCRQSWRTAAPCALGWLPQTPRSAAARRFGASGMRLSWQAQTSTWCLPYAALIRRKNRVGTCARECEVAQACSRAHLSPKKMATAKRQRLDELGGEQIDSSNDQTDILDSFFLRTCYDDDLSRQSIRLCTRLLSQHPCSSLTSCSHPIITPHQRRLLAHWWDQEVVACD